MSNRPHSTGIAGHVSHPTDPATTDSPDTLFPVPRPVAPIPLANVPAILTRPNPNTSCPDTDRGTVERTAAECVVSGFLAPDGAVLPPITHAELSAKPRSPADAHAIAAALGCPDLFLIGGGGVPFLADLIREAARLGNRVCVQTHRVETADELVTNLVLDADFEIGRALADAEQPERLPPASATRTEAAFRQAVVIAERQKHSTEAERIGAKLRQIEELTQLLETLIQEPVSTGTPDGDELTRNRGLVPEQVRAELAEPGETDFGNTIRQARAELIDERQRLDAAIQDATATLDEQSQELARLRDDTDSATATGGLIGRLKGLFHKPDPETVAKREQTAREIETAVQTLTDNLARLTAERVSLEAKQQTALELFVVTEITRRQDDIDAVLTTIRTAAEKRKAQEQAADNLLIAFQLADSFPHDRAEQIQTRDRVNALRDTLHSERSAIQARIQAITPERITFPRPQVVIGPVNAQTNAFVDSDPDHPAFDLLILADAEQLTEDEFSDATRPGRRWILVGDPAGSAQRGHRPLQPGLFTRLWQRQYRRMWSREGSRRVARLAELSYRDAVHTEPLADRPDIELRFTESPDGERVLAAVLFPPTTSAADAKSFLAQELGEIRLTVLGSLRWEEHPEHLTACWPLVAELTGTTGCGVLAEGVHERIVDTGSDILTASVCFDRAAGWTADTAAEWVEQYTQASRTARIALADRPR